MGDVQVIFFFILSFLCKRHPRPSATSLVVRDWSKRIGSRAKNFTMHGQRTESEFWPALWIFYWLGLGRPSAHRASMDRRDDTVLTGKLLSSEVQKSKSKCQETGKTTKEKQSREFDVFAVSWHFFWSRDFVVFPVSRHFLYSMDFSIFAVSGNFLCSKQGAPNDFEYGRGSLN